jgi:tryptophan halogenase
MDEKIRVIVAGGGTAGWLTAYSLVRRLGKLLDITLVESDQIGTVGVGEATIPTMGRFHQFFDIDEREFMRATQASFKLGILFDNWGAPGESYVHSFGEIGQSNWLVEFHQYWLEAHANGFGGRVGFGMNYYQPFDGGYYEVDVNTITRNENEPYLNLFVSKVLFADITFRLDSDNKDYCLEVKALRAGRFALKAGDTPMTYAFHLDATACEPWTISVAVSAGVSMVRRWTVRLG